MFESTLLASQIAARMADQNTRVIREAAVGGEALGPSVASDLIRAGQRDLVVSRLRHWIEEKVQDYLVISDPFFGPEDLDVLKLVLSVKPAIKVRILTSTKHQLQEQVAQPYNASYLNYWRSAISAQDPPDTEITIVGTKVTQSSPIHDRWWLTKSAGLRMGTSYRSLGVAREAELSELSPETAAAFENEVNRYLRREVREHSGEKLSYSAFTLD
jgi:hypothetical protein